jgi:membrane AbrB-like protein
MMSVQATVKSGGARYWAGAVVLTAALGPLMSAWRVPSGWLIAALLSAGAVAVATGHELTPHKRVLRPAQGVIGIIAAAPLAGVAITTTMARYLGISGLCSGATLLLCLGCALVLARAAKTLSPASALLSTLAGGASGISTMAPDLGVDHRYVALSQYLRLIVVTLTLPVVLQLVGGHPDMTGHADKHATLLSAGAAAAIIFGAGQLGLRLKWPAPYLLATMLAALLIEVITRGQFVPALPTPIHIATYVVIGWQAGGSFTRSSIRQFLRLLPLTATFIGVAIGGCLAMAVALSQLTGLSLSQAYLATTPGGIYAVLAAANDSGAGPIVVTMQVFRLLVMVATAIIGAKLLQPDRAPAVHTLRRTLAPAPA